MYRSAACENGEAPGCSSEYARPSLSTRFTFVFVVSTGTFRHPMKLGSVEASHGSEATRRSWRISAPLCAAVQGVLAFPRGSNPRTDRARAAALPALAVAAQFGSHGSCAADTPIALSGNTLRTE